MNALHQTPVLIDSNVLIDIFTDDPSWYKWSRDWLTYLSQVAQLYVNPIIYSEISVSFEKIEELERFLFCLPLQFDEIPKESLFLAGKAYLMYRRRKGNKTSPLPDFYIGAHAVVNNWRVITRDSKRMLYNYPGLQVITPDTALPWV